MNHRKSNRLKNNIKSPTDKAWYLLYTKPRQEKYAKENLVRQNYQVYLPMYGNKRRFRGHYQAVIEPLFPRYLFIRLDTGSDNWAPIRSTYGVSNIVYFGFKPVAIPDSDITELKTHEDDKQVYYPPDQDLSIGDNVRIADGFMTGLEGVLIAKTGRERVQVLLQYIGKQLEITITEDNIEKV